MWQQKIQLLPLLEYLNSYETLLLLHALPKRTSLKMQHE